MKIILSTVILTVCAIGLWQNRELSRLSEREGVLRAEREKTGSPHSGREESGSGSQGRPQIRKSLDPVAFVSRFEKIVASHREPSESERVELVDTLASASPRELKALVDELRRSNLPEKIKQETFSVIAPRLAESQPMLAAEIAVEGGQEDPFRMVMRTWLTADPKAAAGWMKNRNPPLDSTAFRSMDDIDLKILGLTVGVVSDPSGESLGKILRGNDKVQLAGLGEVMMSTHPADFAEITRRVSEDAGVPENERMELVGSVLARHPDPVMVRQILQDAALPEEQFLPAAAILMSSTDPSNMRAAVDWFVGATTESPARTKALRRIHDQWAANSPDEAAAYFREKNLPLRTP